MCISFASGTEQRETCEANAKAFFISNTPSYNERLNRIVKWIRLNHQLGDFPDVVVAKPKFVFSNGAARFWSLCGKMNVAYNAGSGGGSPVDVCEQKIDGTEWTATDLKYQTKMLDGRLPNEDKILDDRLADSNFATRRLEIFRKTEPDHFDHFHLEVSK